MTVLAEGAVRFAPGAARPLRARPARPVRMALAVFSLGAVVGASPLVCSPPIYEVAASIDAQGIPLNEDDLRVLLRDRETLDRVRSAIAPHASAQALSGRLKTSILEGEIHVRFLTQDPASERPIVEALVEAVVRRLQSQVARERTQYEQRLGELAVAINELVDYVRGARATLEELDGRKSLPDVETALKLRLADGGLALNRVVSQVTDLQLRIAKLRDARPAVVEVTRLSAWPASVQRGLMAMLMGLIASAAFLFLVGARRASQTPGA